MPVLRPSMAIIENFGKCLDVIILLRYGVDLASATPLHTPGLPGRAVMTPSLLTAQGFRAERARCPVPTPSFPFRLLAGAIA